MSCPICLELINEPLKTICGHRFCAKCILDWLHVDPHCPLCGMEEPVVIHYFFKSNNSARYCARVRCHDTSVGYPVALKLAETWLRIHRIYETGTEVAYERLCCNFDTFNGTEYD